MFQISLAFLIWIGYGIWEARTHRSPDAYVGLASARLVGRAIGLMGLAVGLLGFTLWLIWRVKGLTPAGLTGPGWAVIIAGGLAFVALEIRAVAHLTVGLRPATLPHPHPPWP